MTWMPAWRNARAAGAWTWFGVTIDTASMPSSRAASRLRHLDGSWRSCASGAMPSSLAEALRPVRVGGKRAGDQLEAVVHPRGDAVDGADEGALPAADHAEADAPADRRVPASANGHGAVLP